MQGSTRSPVPYLLLALVAGAWLAGIAAAATFGAAAWPLALALAAACGAAACWRWSRLAAVYAVLLPLVFLAGVARERASYTPLPEDSIARYNDGPSMRVRGVVREEPARSDASQRLTVDVRDVQVHGEWRDASGGVQAHLPLIPRYARGDVVELEGALETPPRLDDFDYAAFLARRGVHSIVSFPEVRLLGHEDRGESPLAPTRRFLAGGIERALPEPHASLAQGILLGRRAGLPDDINDDLNVSNTSHLVVVSGSNVVIVAWACTMLFGAVLRRRRALAVSIAAVIAYAMLVGPSPPVLRATIMGIVLVLAGMTGRRGHGVTSIAVAAAIMAGIDPPILRDASFQLSFAATAGIITLARPLRRLAVDALGWLLRRDEVPRWLGGGVIEPATVTLAATLAVSPVILLHFGRASVFGLPANMLIVPAFPLMLAASLLAAVGGHLPAVAVVAGAPAYYLLEYWMRVAAWFASLPAAAIDVGDYEKAAAAAACALAVGASLAIAWLAQRAGRAQLAQSHPFRWRTALRRTAYAAPPLLVAVSIGWAASGDAPRRLDVTVLDVGQGDAILIETPDGHDILVDGGPGPGVLRALGEELPWHDRSLDLIVLTHPQLDHGAGLIDVFARYDVSRVVAPATDDESALYSAWVRAASRETGAIEPARAGMAFDLGHGVQLEVLAAGDDGGALETNDASTVLRLTWGEVSFLLTGDIEADGEQRLLEGDAEVRATMLKVPHHGSKTSSTAAFLAAVQPEVSVISASGDNRFGHPDAGVTERLGAYGPVYVTARDGSVRLRTDGTRVWVDTAR